VFGRLWFKIELGREEDWFDVFASDGRELEDELELERGDLERAC